VVNPQLAEISSELATDDEGCLSIEGIRVPVERSTKVTLEGKDPAGGDVSWELEGLTARVVQHELDHLDGVLIIDRTDDEHRRQALGELRPKPVRR
jgi:peptide deformylase